MDLKKIGEKAKDLLESEGVKDTIAAASNKVSELRSEETQNNTRKISSKENTQVSTSQKTTNDSTDIIAMQKKLAEWEKQEEAEREAKEAKREAKRKARNEAYKENNPQLMKKYKELAQEGTAFAYIEICQAPEHESYFKKSDGD